MKQALAFALCASMLVGCGPYRIRYVKPTEASTDGSAFVVTKAHAHGVGPLIVGGGGFFFLFQSMSPALIDYTGEVDLRTVCPEGYDDFSEVRHYFNFGHNALAGLISWLAVGNWYHRSHVAHTCMRGSAAHEQR